ncbi:MAG: translation elongation factor Ts [Chloroflexota bacterium]
MADISATLIKDLREATGAGVMDCRKALLETSGDLEKAKSVIVRKGLERADKLSEREASQGLVDAYVHGVGNIGVLVEVNCGTDFVARNGEFKELVHEIALQIAAANPLAVSMEDLDPAWVEQQRARLRADGDLAGKPADIQDKMIQGRLEKQLQEVVLLKQPHIKDPSRTIEDLVKEKSGKFGEPIRIRRFARFELGR